MAIPTRSFCSLWCMNDETELARAHQKWVVNISLALCSNHLLPTSIGFTSTSVWTRTNKHATRFEEYFEMRRVTPVKVS